MPRTAITAVLIVLSASTIFLAQQPLKARLEGTVTRAGSAEPVAGARLTLTRDAAEGAAPEPVITDRNGKFTFQEIAPGSYKLKVKANGYAETDAREDHGRRVSGPVVLAAGQNIQDMAIRLTPAGTISGHIRNLSGHPFAGVSVELIRRAYSMDGSPALDSVASAITDDRGEYRLYWVRPGRYYVRAPGPPLPHLFSYGVNYVEFARNGNNEVAAQYGAGFFPGVPDIADAAIVDIPPSGEITNVDFAVPPLQLFHIRGRVIDARTGVPPAQGTVTVLGSGIGFSIAYDKTDGTFDTGPLKPGTNFLTASDTGMKTVTDWHFENLSRPGQATAAAKVVLLNSDVDGVQLTLSSLPPIAGRIRVEGSLPSSVTLDRLRVAIRPADLNEGSRFSQRQAAFPIQADGTFTVNAVSDGEFRVAMPALPAGLYLKQATLDGQDVLNRYLPFKAGPLEIVISSHGARVEGGVTDDRLLLMTGVQAVLVPDQARDRFELFKAATTDAEGHFTISDVAPGDYKLFAWEELEPYEYFDPDFQKRFEQRGTPVHVSESSRQTIALRMIRVERAQ